MIKAHCKLVLIAAALSLAGWGCPPPLPAPPQPPQDASADLDGSTPATLPDGAAASPCERACARLSALGCPEMGPACVPTCVKVLATHLTPFDPDCIIGSVSVAEVRKCPAIRCPQ